MNSIKLVLLAAGVTAVCASFYLISGPASGSAQRSGRMLEADGGGEAPVMPNDEITDEQREEIQDQIDKNLLRLEREGLLAPASPEVVAFGWPVRKPPGIADNGVDAISNYVDQNPAYPSLLLDWNCGTRTYDQASGYNHKGIDIFTWPFTWKKMDNFEVEVAAGAPGTIVFKSDGNFDRNCGFNSSQWNAVYIRHADNSIAWYGHLKNGSVTSKPVGATVDQEKLGNVGSSGNSTGPHLHFELYNSANQLQDPFQGPCNTMNAFTWWAEQEPYRASRVNRLMTHSGPPVFPACPTQETTNEKTVFRPGNEMTTAAYYRDQSVGQQTQFSLLRPNGSVFQPWSHNSPNTYSASYWYWNWIIPGNAPTGIWKFRASFNGVTYDQEFTVSTNATVSGRVVDPAGRGIRSATVSITSPQNVTRTILTSSLGYYSFENVQIGGTYNVRVNSKRFRFNARDVAVNDNVSDVDFTGIE